MAYFFILPAFMLWLVVATVAVLITKHASQFISMFPYVWRISLWATLGFVLANLLLWAVIALGFTSLNSETSNTNREGLQLAVGLAAIVGPILASLAGWLFGAIFGFVLAWRKIQNA